MVSETQQRLLDEFEGLFAAGSSGLEGFAGGQMDPTQTPVETSAVADAAKAPTGAADVSEPARTVSMAASVEQLVQSLAGQGTASEMSPQASAAATTAGVNTHGGVPATQSSSDGGTSVGSVVTTFLESGMGIVPLITGLIGLFSGGGGDAAPALQKYVMPSAISFESADVGRGLMGADSDQSGAPRAYSADADVGLPLMTSGIGVSGGSSAGYRTDAPRAYSAGGDAGSPWASPVAGVPSGGVPGGGVPGGGNPANSAGAAPQITVNVQAMDAQSFMDYSSQIAQAVRGAMLNLSSLNDVVNEL